MCLNSAIWSLQGLSHRVKRAYVVLAQGLELEQLFLTGLP